MAPKLLPLSHQEMDLKRDQNQQKVKASVNTAELNGT